MSRSSTTLISKERIIRACEDYLTARKHRIENTRDFLIVAEMRKRWFPAKTLDKAIERLEADIWGDWYRCSNRGRYFADIAENLLLLAKHSDTEFVSVSAEDVEVIGKWL